MLEAVDTHRRTALAHAASTGYDTVVSLLLDRGDDAGPSSRDRAIALHKAAWNGHEATVSLLLERGARIGKRDVAFLAVRKQFSDADERIFRLLQTYIEDQ